MINFNRAAFAAGNAYLSHRSDILKIQRIQRAIVVALFSHETVWRDGRRVSDEDWKETVKWNSGRLTDNKS